MRNCVIEDVAVILPGGVVESQSVLCRDGRISGVGPYGEYAGAEDVERVDGGGCYLSPGFIDLHIHGVHSHRVDCGVGELEAVCGILPRYGVTGFLPTIQPRPKGEDAEYVKRLAGIVSGGTEVLGFHMEGPFVSLTGALPKEALGANDPGRVRALIEASGPYRAIFSIAPDFEGITDLIPLMAENDTPVFMTHTAASVKQTQAAIAAGACHATHFYDVFPCPPVTEGGARPCGAVEAILADRNVSVDFIVDGEHVDPVAVQVALQCKGPDGVCLITDANVGAGLPPGVYEGFGGLKVEFAYEGAPARETAEMEYPGALAGSGLTMDRAVRNAMKLVGVDLCQAVRMASTNPAKVLRLDGRKGMIKAGFDADMVLLDRDLLVKQCWVGGKSCYQRA